MNSFPDIISDLIKHILHHRIDIVSPLDISAVSSAVTVLDQYCDIGTFVGIVVDPVNPGGALFYRHNVIPTTCGVATSGWGCIRERVFTHFSVRVENLVHLLVLHLLEELLGFLEVPRGSDIKRHFDHPIIVSISEGRGRRGAILTVPYKMVSI